MMNGKNWVAWLMRNYRITFLLVGLTFVLGLFGVEMMPKAEFPDFTIRQGVVVAVYPGATAEEVEMQVARPLERYLFTFNEVKRSKTTATSSNGMCIVMVELEDNVNNKDEVWSKIRHGINNFKSSLPSGVLAVVVNDDFGETSALLLALESEHRSYRELQKYSDELADRLRTIETVSNVRLYGETNEQISIYIDRERLSEYGIGQVQLVKGLNAASLTTLSGSISGWNKNVPIHVKPSMTNEEEIENTIIFTDPNNHVVRVKDIAQVRREYDLSESHIEYNGHPCVILSLEMKPGNNIVHYGKDVQRVMDEYVANCLPSDVTVQRITDQCKVVGDSVKDFLLNLLEAMVTIIVVMLLLFPWRTAVVAGAIVPLNTFISVGIMYIMGIPLNIVTFAALIIVMGMVVDNAIVILDGYMEYIGKGMSRWHAAAASAQKYFMPMAVATLCITIIFFPLLFFLKGVVGDMIFWLPWTMAINLMISLALAVVVIPIMEYFAIKRPSEENGEGKKQKRDITYYVQSIYERALDWTFRHPWATIVGAIALIAGSVLLIAPRLDIRMMPEADRDQFAVEITLPEGRGLSETSAVADSISSLLRADKRVKSVTSFVGCSSPRFHAAYAPKMAGRNYAQLIVNTTSVKSTLQLLDEMEPISNAFPNCFIKFKQLDYKDFPPFEYRFYGENADSLYKVTDRIMQEMRLNPQVVEIRRDWDQPRPYIEVELDPVTTPQLGLNRTLVEMELAIGTGDITIGDVWEEDYRIPLRMKDRYKDSLDSDDIKNIYISVGNVSVPLRQTASVKPTWGNTRIVHRQGLRCMTILAEAKRGTRAKVLQSEFLEIIEKTKMPEGVYFEVGGEIENDRNLSADVIAGLSVAVVLIFFFLLFNFKRYKMTFVSIAAITLCVPSALLGLWIMNRTIAVTTVFGVVTLMGMIMRNEILIFEHADGLMKEGRSARDAAYNAGKRRMVPIFLTTATTAMGVVPMIIAGTSFWMPVGVTICAGGIGSLVMVVLVLPVVYWKLNEKRVEK